MMLFTIITCILLLIFLIITLILKARKNRFVSYSLKQRELGDRINRAYYANARIVQSEGGITGEQASKARIKLTLQILTDHDKPYITKTTWLVDITALDYVKLGNEISVKIDYEDPKIIYPAAPWATYVIL